MRKAGRTGLDSAGGIIIGLNAPNVICNGVPIAVVGDLVDGHGFGNHGGPVMAAGSPNVFAKGIPVCRESDPASCGHALLSGSEDTYVN